MLIRSIFFAASIVPVQVAAGQAVDFHSPFKGPGDRSLAEKCSGELVDDIYNIEIELSNIPEACNETDFVELGRWLSVVVSEADELVPQFVDEFMYTTMCEEPEEVEVTSERRLIRIDSSHRGLGRYALKYLGGGVCRRCKTDSKDRRNLRQDSSKRNLALSTNLVQKGNTLVHESDKMIGVSKEKRALLPDEADEKEDSAPMQSKEEVESSSLVEESEPPKADTSSVAEHGGQVEVKEDYTAKDICKMIEDTELSVQSIEKALDVDNDDDSFEIMKKIMKIGGNSDAELVRLFHVAVEYNNVSEECKHKTPAQPSNSFCRQVKKEEAKGNTEKVMEMFAEAQQMLEAASSKAEIVNEAASISKETRVQMFEKGQKYQRAYICKMSRLAAGEKLNAEAAEQKVRGLKMELVELMADFGDEQDVDSTIRSADKEVQNCERYAKDTRKASESAEDMCARAPKRAPGRELHESVEESEEAYKEAADSGKKARKSFYKMKDTLIKSKRTIYDADHKEEMENLSMVSDEVAAIEADLAAVETAMQKLEQRKKTAKNKGQKQKMENELKRLRRAEQKLEMQKRQIIQDARKRLEWSQNVAHKTFEAEKARSIDEWNKQYEEVLKEYVPQRMLEGYGFPDGCLDEEPKIEVEVVPLEDSGDSNTLEQCTN